MNIVRNGFEITIIDRFDEYDRKLKDKFGGWDYIQLVTVWRYIAAKRGEEFQRKLIAKRDSK